MHLTGGNGRNMGAAGSAIGLGAAAGSVLGGLLGAVGPLVPIYAGVIVLVGAALLAVTVRDRAPGDAGGASPGVVAVLGRLRHRPELCVPLAFGFIDRLTAGFLSLVSAFYFKSKFGLGTLGVGLTLALFFLSLALLQYPFGSLSDRVGRLKPVVGGSIAYGLAIAGVGLAPVYPLAALFMIAVGVCGALVGPATMALVTDVAAPDERGAAMGMFSVVGSLGFLVGVRAGGEVEATGYPVAFLAVGGAELAIALLALPAVRRIAPAATTATEAVPGPSE